MSADERLIYLPLGGAGEVGMNAYVYGYGRPGKERLILVDLGVTFPDMDGSPGVNLIMPDMRWLIDNRERLEAIFITHGHEDHVGAVARFPMLLDVPVYARAFTANLAQQKLEEAGLDPKGVRTVSPWPEMTQAGPFRVGYVPVSHSIPESAGLAIDSPAGRIVHSGDFKIDHAPVVGEPFDEALWREVARPGVKALVCDSTNVFVDRPGRSESDLPGRFDALFATARGLIAATTFASNIARLKMLAEAAERAGRSVCILGRAMRRMVEAGAATGVLTGFPRVVSPEDAQGIPRENLMILATGSQGERRAASAQLSRGKFNGIEMREGDMFLFSSKTIPGNERGVIRVMNQFSEIGVDVIDEHSGFYHVSGHANRPDLVTMHNLIDPDSVIPMHGEHRMLREHVHLAEAHGRVAVLAVNGTMVDLTGPKPEVSEMIETGRTYLDGTVMIGALDGIVRDRIRMALNGHVIVTLIIDDHGEPLGEPWCETMGLAESGASRAPLVEVLEADLGQFLNRASHKTLADDDRIERELKRIVRKVSLDEIGKKPEVTVITSRLA